MKLVLKNVGLDGGEERYGLCYFHIVDDDEQVLYESWWFDPEDHEDLWQVRSEVVVVLMEHGLNPDLVKSEDYRNWGEPQ